MSDLPPFTLPYASDHDHHHDHLSRVIPALPPSGEILPASRSSTSYILASSTSVMTAGSSPDHATTHMVVSAQPRDRAPNYGKLIGLCTNAALLLVPALAMLSIQFPNESTKQRNNRGICLVVLSIVLILFTILKIVLEHKQDRAGMFYNHPRRANKRVFYAKLGEHTIGIMVVVFSFAVAAVNYIKDKYNEGDEVAYGIILCQIAISFLYSAILNYGKQNNNALVGRTTNEETTI